MEVHGERVSLEEAHPLVVRAGARAARLDREDALGARLVAALAGGGGALRSELVLCVGAAAGLREGPGGATQDPKALSPQVEGLLEDALSEASWQSLLCRSLLSRCAHHAAAPSPNPLS